MAESVAEVVPDIAKVGGRLAQSSVITGRRRVRLVPQSGQTYTSGNSAGVVNILIQDGQAYADLLSAVVSFTLTTWDSTTGNVGPTIATNGTITPPTNYCIPDDGAWSVFRRSLISVNSTLMDDTDMVAKKVNAELYATASQDWYNSVGSFCGLWKYNTTQYGYADGGVPITGVANTAGNFQAPISKYDILSKGIQYANVVQGSTAGASPVVLPGENKFCIPLSLLTSFFRNDTLFPSRNAGQLYVQLNLASAVEATFNWLSANNANSSSTPNYRIDNLTLEIDFVDLHPTYLEMMDGLIESPSGEGVSWAFDAHLVATQNINAGSGPQSVVVSKASQNLRSLQVLVQPQLGMSSGNYPAQSTFSNPGLIDIQYRIGSLYYPAFTAVGENRAFMDLQNAFGSPESVDKCGLVDSWNYYLYTPTNALQPLVAGNLLRINANGVLYTYGGTAGAPTSGTGAQLSGSRFADMFMYAYCFDRLKHAKYHGIDLDGVNTLTSAGSQMVVQLNANEGENSVLVAIVRFTRILKLGGGATSVIG